MNFPFGFLFSDTGETRLIFPDAPSRPATDVEVTLWRALQEALAFEAKTISQQDAENAVAVVLRTSSEPSYLDSNDIGTILGETKRFPRGTPLILLRHGETLETLSKERKQEILAELTLYDEKQEVDH